MLRESDLQSEWTEGIYGSAGLSAVSAKHCFQTVDKAEVTVQNQPQLAQGHNKKGEIIISSLLIACTFTMYQAHAVHPFCIF